MAFIQVASSQTPEFAVPVTKMMLSRRLQSDWVDSPGSGLHSLRKLRLLLQIRLLVSGLNRIGNNLPLINLNQVSTKTVAQTAKEEIST